MERRENDIRYTRVTNREKYYQELETVREIRHRTID